MHSESLPRINWKSTWMEKIDRLGWAAGFSFIVYGTRVGVRTNNPKLLEQLQDRFPPGWKPASSPTVERLYSLLQGGAGSRPGVRRFNLLYGGIAKLARSTDLDEVLERFESDVQLYVAEVARRRVFVHAGVVGWRGKAIVMPGRSFSGKTSLVAALVRAGATYYSDEYAVLDERGRVHPFAKPLSLREGGDGDKQTKVKVEALGGVTGVKPLAVGLVVVSQYRSGARWRPRLLTGGQGALELLANTVPARRKPEAVLATFQHVVSPAPVLKGPRDEAGDVARWILELTCTSSW